MLMYYRVGEYSVLMIMDLCILSFVLQCIGGSVGPFSLLKGFTFVICNFGCKICIDIL